MGVPAFFRWLIEKYPKVLTEMLEKRQTVIDGVWLPLDLNSPNPNGIEWDNLYIDMNGLIHPCAHPIDREAPGTEAEMYVDIGKYLDRLFAAVRPRKLLFLAIDGVAPRAKMNQQRMRRFRAAQDAKDKQKMMDDVLAEMEGLGMGGPPEASTAWDSNVITPGTDFMEKLSVYVRFYILERMNNDPAWKNIKVILSDATVPGEGEHKIMQFIRTERAQPGYNPNQRHILHGLDADLIMLALATHEPHFTILRELVEFGNKNRDKPTKSDAQKMLDAQSFREMAESSAKNPADEWVFSKPLNLLSIPILREYLAGEFQCLETSLPFEYDFERVIDDFVFLCFFVGNDFLPHLPSLDLKDGALDFLIEVYKELLPSLGDYVTSPGGIVNLRQADVILARVGEIEDQVFRMRKAAEDASNKRIMQAKEHRKMQASNMKLEGTKMLEHYNNQERKPVPPQLIPPQVKPPVPTAPIVKPELSNTLLPSIEDMKAQLQATLLKKKGLEVQSNVKVEDDKSGSNQRNKEAAQRLQEMMKKKTPNSQNEVEIQANDDIIEKVNNDYQSNTDNIVDQNNDDSPELVEEVVEEEATINSLVSSVVIKTETTTKEVDIVKVKEELKKRLKEKESKHLDHCKETIQDTVKLHEAGWKDRYYGDKYKKESIEAGGGLENMRKEYVKGLCWVLKYYYDGCPSWNWYYPFHYAPFASDLVNIDSYQFDFEMSEPFRPVEQLLAVLPADSVHALPDPCQWLMTDPESPIFDLYGFDAPIDANGKHLPWLWILLLPFIDESRISAAFNMCKDSLTLDDRRRNRRGGTIVFVHRKYPLAVNYLSSNSRYRPGKETDAEMIEILSKKKQSIIMNDAEDSVESSNNSSDEADNAFYFNSEQGDGICGYVSNPPPLVYAPVDKSIQAPRHPIGAYEDIPCNNVLCFTFQFPESMQHSSKLLEGLELPPPVLNKYDLVPRKPPRLNRGFNILDINKQHNNGRQSSGGGYQQQGGYHQGGYQQQGGYQLQGGYQQQGGGYQQQGGYYQQGGYQQQVGYQQQQYGAFQQQQYSGGFQQQQQYGSYQQQSYGGHQQQYRDNKRDDRKESRFDDSRRRDEKRRDDDSRDRRDDSSNKRTYQQMQSFGQEMSSKQYQSASSIQNTHTRFNTSNAASQQHQGNTQGFSFRAPHSQSSSQQQLPRPANPPMTMQDMRSQLLNSQNPVKKAKTNTINPMELAANDPRLNLKPATSQKKK